MKPFEFHDFEKNPAWCVTRLDTELKTQPIDIYVLMDLPSGLALAQEIVQDPNGATLLHVRSLIAQAQKQYIHPPKRLFIAKGEPSIPHFEVEIAQLGMALEVVPASYLEIVLTPLRESFAQHFFSPSSLPYAQMEETADDDDRESARNFIPDSFDPCPCASGLKFKFCCKPGFADIIGAMAAAQSGFHLEAMNHIAKAKEILGETAEVLSREAVVQSYVDEKKAMKILAQALQVNPHHPRANYIRGVDCKRKGDFHGAILAYKIAIQNYPKTDRYHLNEAYNNLGNAYFEIGEMTQAKSAWEQALTLLPSDKTVRQNLQEFIYENSDLPASVREISPFILRILKRR